MYVTDPDVNILYKKADTEVNNLFNWFCVNKLSLNSEETNIVIIPHMKQLNLNSHKLKINGTPLSRVGHNCKETAIKFLGIYRHENKYGIYFVSVALFGETVYLGPVG